VSSSALGLDALHEDEVSVSGEAAAPSWLRERVAQDIVNCSADSTRRAGVNTNSSAISRLVSLTAPASGSYWE
jgi:hypothetical protein